MERVLRLASQNAAVIFSTSSCCMCHAIKRLFCELGVNLAIYELDEDNKGREMEKALNSLLGHSPSVPVVFIEGKLIGSTDKVMSLHLSCDLIPLLKKAGAIWL
ncbi:glutaredoxin-C1-like [Tasmannia lanceolata]|uniref:glutaredoxin-C1-like n=1 Tax=Tasmannia lanceolata TaxID=3420 RepID=UPI004063A5CE